MLFGITGSLVCHAQGTALVIVLLVAGAVVQLVGVAWTARDLERTRRELLKPANRVTPVVVMKRGMPGTYPLGQDPETRLVQDALNSAVEDVNRRLGEIATGALKLHGWSLVAILTGIGLTMLGSVLAIGGSVICR